MLCLVSFVLSSARTVKIYIERKRRINVPGRQFGDETLFHHLFGLRNVFQICLRIRFNCDDAVHSPEPTDNFGHWDRDDMEDVDLVSWAVQIIDGPVEDVFRSLVEEGGMGGVGEEEERECVRNRDILCEW